ncbi:conserved unknown protein [Ectocarpus siliculosus]|uniref:Pentacotripeptide-repeat region of PRORP domain-containing protein n=1 Tax=Ectocarpus siliculosus TaxID=2880 RepID=D7FKA8_ECTSI|nr:conserved unknown protein [Ectocarpus siliculosus]|eukprot:CBJ29311.1 conserved unknown protein [Ectocarpus siliculosus]
MLESREEATLRKKVAGVNPNAYTYNSAIRACGKEGRWAEAVAVFRRMAKRGVAPDEVSFLAAIEACGKGKEWALAVALLREMSTTPTGPRDGEGPPRVTGGGEGERRGCEDGARSTAAVAADQEAGDGGGGDEKRKAASLTSAHEPVVADVLLYNAAIAACGQAGQWRQAVRLLSEISEMGLFPSVKAVSLLEEMRAVGLTPVSSTYLPAIDACYRAGQGKVGYALTKQRDAAQRRMRRHPDFASTRRSQQRKLLQPYEK